MKYARNVDSMQRVSLFRLLDINLALYAINVYKADRLLADSRFFCTADANLSNPLSIGRTTVSHVMFNQLDLSDVKLTSRADVM